MKTLHCIQAGEQTFTRFLFYNRRNRITLYLAAAAIILQFMLFKYLYPFANYIHGDSFNYLKAAAQNATINTYPIGYSKFLRLVSVFAKPDLMLVTLQYLMIQCSALFLFFTVFYFHSAGSIVRNTLLCFMIINPLSLHLGNLVSSDGLFLALSMTWLALLLWIVHKPSSKIIIWHAIVLFAAFTVRYNALIYPLISLPAFWLSKLPLRKKVAGLGLGLLLCCWFAGLSIFQYKKLTGFWQYSPFSGWQLANNALYAYRGVDSADRQPVPIKFRVLDNMVRTFYDANPNLYIGEANAAFMWMPMLPLIRYNNSLFNVKDMSEPTFKEWANMGPFYSSYGWYIIKKYPLHFLRYFVWPNTRKYLAPPVEYLEYYNFGATTVPASVWQWFGLDNNQIRTRTKTNQVVVLQHYPYLVSITNLIILFGILAYLLLKGLQFNETFHKTILLAGFAWLLNVVFTILASSVALRFQAFPIMLNTILSLLLIDWMIQLMQTLKLQNQQQQTANIHTKQLSEF